MDPCFIADDLLDKLPTPAQVGKIKVGGIDDNQPRMRLVVRQAAYVLKKLRGKELMTRSAPRTVTSPRKRDCVP